jgi:hypothetical protein
MNSEIVQQHFTNAKLKSNKDGEKNFAASCKHCIGRTISGNIYASTNFVKHLRVSAT